MRNAGRCLRFQILAALVLGSITRAAFGQVFVEPAKQITSLPFTISKSGTYYVQANLIGKSGHDGITINADFVTVDLQKFILIGGSGTGVGIRVGDNHTFVTIEGGGVGNWGSQGIYSPNAQVVINGTFADNNGSVGIVVKGGSLVENLAADFNTGNGIDASDGSTVRSCFAHNNGGTGISAGLGCNISSCTVTANAQNGIVVSDNSLVGNCIANANNNTGLQGGANCVVSDCTVYSNNAGGIVITDNGRVSGCQVASNNGNGITSGDFSPVVSNTTRSNVGNGISVGTNCLVSGNIAVSNGAGSAAGILANGDGCLIHENDLINNGVGIKVVATSCAIHNNRAHANTLGDYVIAGGNDFAPTGTVAASTSPWANISY